MRLRIPDANLLEGPMLKNILLFAIPIMFSSILQLLFNAADIIVVGKFAGPNELAAVGSTGAIVNLVVNICIGFSVGANVLVARHIGARDKLAIERTVHSAMFMSMVLGVFGGVLLFFLSRPVLHLMDSPADILPSSAAYLKAYAVGIPASIIYNFGTAVLRARGDTARPLYFLIIAGIVNVCLNMIFVLVFHMGAVGVGIATAVAQYVSATLIVICLMHEEGPTRLYPSRLRLYKQEALDIVINGFPASLQSSFFSLSNMIIQSSVNSFGATVVAGNAAAANIEGFVYVAMNSIYQTMLTLAGQNLGARQYKRIDKGLGTSIATVSVIGLVLGIGVVLLDEQLLSIYTSDPAVVAWGCKRFLFLALPYFICGIMDTLVGALRGLGYSFFPMCVSLMGACVFRIVWIYTVFQRYHTIESLFISYIISWVMTGVAHLITYLVVRKKVRVKYEKEAEPAIV